MIIQTQEELLIKLNEWSEVEFLGCDIETERISETKPIWSLEIFGIGFYSSLGGFYIPLHPVYPTIDISVLKEFFQNKTMTFHNANFDISILENYGFDFSTCSIQDTKLMSFLLNENRPSHKLKDLAQEVLKVENPTRYDEVAYNPLEMFPQDAIQKMGEYCIDDCMYTYKLYNLFKPKLEEQELLALYEKIELPLMHVIRSMQRRGIKVDIKKLEEKDALLLEDLISLQSEIWKLCGKEINIASSDQLGKVFFEDLKYPYGERSDKTNKWKCPEEVLSKLAGEGYELAQKILSFRERSKLRNTYTQGLQKAAVDGIIYAQFNQTGARTGRMSSSSPNLQQLPRRSDKYNIRECFSAREGYSFIIADYSQIELRVLAHFTGDTNMLNTYINGGDIHQLTADMVQCTRQDAKIINFGIIYGMSSFALGHTLKIETKKADEFIANYFASYPKVKSFIDATIQEAYKKGFVTSFTKRRRRLMKELYQKTDIGLQKHAERQSANFRIQGSAADVIKLAMRNIYAKLKEYDAHILIQIHDELIVECLDSQIEVVTTIIKEEMEKVVQLRVPLVVEPHVSKVWEK